VHQVAPVFFASDDFVAGFLDAARAERIGLPREAKRGLGLFPGLQQRLVRPLWSDGRIRIALVEILNGVIGDRGGFANDPIETARDLCANRVGGKTLALTFKSDEKNLLS